MTTEENAAALQKAVPLLSKTKMKGAALALGGMIVGSIVGLGVQFGVQSTGLLGPSVDALMQEQQANFDDVNARLATLSKSSTDPETKKSLAELASILKRQDELSQHANAELQYLGEQVQTFKAQQLAESGHAGGADFWLKAGESVNVAGDDQVFALLGARSTFADINLSGTRKRISIGDVIEVQSGDRTCSIFYKQATPRADRRVGFDLDCV
ncbi:MAG: hypothetical protein OEW64_06445 [Gammaproteobacteria bacterium]|nr:hypothetical protein [Gammaproteobacteria bacterium]MDH5303718.1 hypothetical protein [Gammaproteobacteria bacterium]MDH5322700.1 hypothetical protein [Gammaproteobacteria bacterium]